MSDSAEPKPCQICGRTDCEGTHVLDPFGMRHAPPPASAEPTLTQTLDGALRKSARLVERPPIASAEDAPITDAECDTVVQLYWRSTGVPSWTRTVPPYERELVRAGSRAADARLTAANADAIAGETAANKRWQRLNDEACDLAERNAALQARVEAADWRKWDGEYEKQSYDVWTDRHNVVMGCWPNAGRMVATDGSGRQWRPADCIAVRVSQFQGEPPSLDAAMGADKGEGK